MKPQHKKRSTFSGKLGFVLSAAGASVGLGNIWRFPYLAAKYGGGIFLLIYIVLALTFGYTMITAETAIGRMTQKSPVGAYKSFGKSKWLSFGGWINAIIPILIVPYYSVIGGWVIRYLADYVSGHGSELATDGYFSAFISSGASAEICFVIFTIFTLAIIFAGVRNGVERVSKVMMPILVVLSVIIAHTVLGPIGWKIGTFISDIVYAGISGSFRVVFGAIFGFVYAPLVITGLHHMSNAIGVGGIPGILSIQPAYMLSFALCMAIAIVVPFVLTVIVGKKKGVA